MSKYAYVFAMFLGDAYLQGVLVMAYSLFKTNTIHDVVCMVTPDVSEDAKAKMRYIGIKVVNVEYIYTNPHFEVRPAMKKRYPNIGKFSTKWNCLNLVEYKKIFFLDVDMIVQQNIDHVFKLPAPATRLVIHIPTNTSTTEFGLHASLLMEDGEKLPNDVAETFMYRRSGNIDGGCMLLKPSAKRFKKILKYLKNFDIRKLNHVMSDDEIALFAFYVEQKKQWHNLGVKWSCIYWKYKGGCSLEDSYILNFIGTKKPWEEDMSLYPDTKKWYQYYNEMKNEYPKLIVYKF